MAGSSKRARVREAVRNRLEMLDVGDTIPPERQLATEFGVSRMTLRHAIEDLVREGVLARRQGRGTFVAAPKIAYPLTMTSFSEEMRRRGHVPTSRTVDMIITSAGPRVSRRLEISPAAEIIRACRLRLADGEPMAIERLHVPSELVPGLSPERLASGSFYDILEQDYGITVDHGMQTIEPTVTTEEEATLLKVPVHSPALLFGRTTRNAGDRVIEYVDSVYRGDRYKLVAELQPSTARSARPVTG